MYIESSNFYQEVWNNLSLLEKHWDFSRLIIAGQNSFVKIKQYPILFNQKYGNAAN